MDCVVLAGGTPSSGDSLHGATGGLPKALVDLAGRPMLHWVLDALAASRTIDRVIVVGLALRDCEACRDPVQHGNVVWEQGPGDIVGNLYQGISRLDARRPAAFCWSDIPLITAPMVDRFVEQAVAPEIDINAGLVRRETLLQRYPEHDDRWLRLAEGRYIAADLGVFHPRHASRVRRNLEALAPLRKSAMRQATQLGVSVLLRYALGRLGRRHLVEHVRRQFGLEVAIREVQDPELGLDVDSPAALELCRRVLTQRRA